MKQQDVAEWKAKPAAPEADYALVHYIIKGIT